MPRRDIKRTERRVAMRTGDDRRTLRRGEPHVVYRLFAADGRLLYVGLAAARNLGARLREHRRKDWWTDVARAATSWHANFEEARLVEALAIRDDEPVHNRRITTHVPDWNDAGYDLAKTTRFVYAFLRSDASRVKIGTVSRVERLEHRRREVSARCNDAGLRMVAHVAIDDIDSHVLEGYEGAIQLYLHLAVGLEFGHAVDWLAVPDDSPVRNYDADQWQQLLNDGVQAIDQWRNENADP